MFPFGRDCFASHFQRDSQSGASMAAVATRKFQCIPCLISCPKTCPKTNAPAHKELVQLISLSFFVLFCIVLFVFCFLLFSIFFSGRSVAFSLLIPFFPGSYKFNNLLHILNEIPNPSHLAHAWLLLPLANCSAFPALKPVLKLTP